MRLIDADTLKPSHIVASTTTNSLCHLYVSLDDINNAPTIETESVRHGWWITIKDDFPMCSECGYFSPFDHDKCDYEYGNYCPNCGAKMVEEEGLENTSSIVPVFCTECKYNHEGMNSYCE